MERTFFIGIGGAGGKTLRFLHHELKQRLHRLGWDGALPRSLAFLHIDLPDRLDANSPDVPSVPELDAKYLSLARSPAGYSSYDMAVWRDNPEREDVSGWRPSDPDRMAPPYLGSGQVRAVGRMVGLATLSAIRTKLDQEVEGLAGATATIELAVLNKLLRQAPAPFGGSQAFVIGSLSGGTGSGLLLDVMELLAHIGSAAPIHMSWPGGPIGVLFTPDVMRWPPKELRRGMNPNALATISELLNAAHSCTPHTADGALLAADGAPPRMRSGRINYLVGSNNSRLQFDSSAAVYKATACALASFVLDSRVSESWGRALAMPAVPRRSSFDLLDRASPTSSFGYSTVSLGRDLFEMYAADRVAHRCVERLLWGHMEEAPGERLSEAIIADVVRPRRDSFFEATGFVPPTWQAKLLDDLRTPEHDSSHLERAVLTRLGMETQDRGSEEPRRGIEALHREIAQIEANEWYRLSQRLKAWIAATKERVLRTSVATVAEIGIPATLVLVTDLIDQMRAAEGATQERDGRLLETESERYDDARKGDRRLWIRSGQGRDNLETAVARIAVALKEDTEQRIAVAACAMLREFIDTVLSPLRDALERSRNRLYEQSQVVSSWSTGAVRPSLQPAPNEVLLDSFDEIPSKFDELLCATYGCGVAEALTRASVDVITGCWPIRADGSVKIDRIEAECRRAGAMDVTIPFGGALDASTLRSKALKWTRTRQGPISAYIAESLGGYLGAVEHVARRGPSFVAAMQRALQLAEPLIDISVDVERLVHSDGPSGLTYAISGIPLHGSHPYRAAVEQLLAAVVPASLSGMASTFEPDSESQSIDIVVLTERPFHPIVAESLVGPVVEQWRRSWHDKAESGFWRGRRSDTLTRFVPFSKADIDRIIAGFLVGSLLGQMRPIGGIESQEARPAEVWHPEAGWLALPFPLLGYSASRGQVGLALLPHVLESAPLALLDLSQQDRTSLDAFSRLAEMGTSPFPELREWLDSGGGADELSPPRLGGYEIKARRISLRRALTKIISSLETILDEPLDETPVVVNPLREIAPDVIAQARVLWQVLPDA